jgi:hypothetical protein
LHEPWHFDLEGIVVGSLRVRNKISRLFVAPSLSATTGGQICIVPRQVLLVIGSLQGCLDQTVRVMNSRLFVAS